MLRLQVDLGGWLSQQGPAGWLYSPALALGVVEALLEQLLGSVGLVKAEVEAQRFAVRAGCSEKVHGRVRAGST